MSFFKTFGICMVTFLCLNLIHRIVFSFLLGFTFDYLLLLLLSGFFGSITHSLSNGIYNCIMNPSPISRVSITLSLMIPILSSIIAGNYAETKYEAFGAWLLTAIISTASILVINNIFLFPKFPEFFGSLDKLFRVYIETIRDGVINGFFYGFFALTVILLKQRRSEAEE